MYCGFNLEQQRNIYMIDYSHYKAEDFLLDDSFIEYCRNKNAAVIKIWEIYVATYPKVLEEVLLAKKMYHTLSITVTPEEKQHALNKFKEFISKPVYEDKSPGKYIPVYPVSFWKKKKKQLFQVTAAALIVGILLTTVTRYINTRDQTNSAANYSRAKFINTIYGSTSSRKTITLPDGSAVTLNVGSNIKLDQHYNKNKRWLLLEGEAFFSVKPDEKKPFVVFTGKTATTATGTSFKIRNFVGEQQSNTMLATGKVTVTLILEKNSAANYVTLLPGEEAVLNKNNKLSKSSFNLALLQDWQHTNIAFNNAGLEEISRQLQNYYGVRLMMADKQAGTIAFTGKFYEKPLSDVLEAIAFTNSFSYLQKADTVLIRFK